MRLRTARISFLLAVALLTVSAPARAQDTRVVLRAGTLLDGRGGVSSSASLLVAQGRIERVGTESDIAGELTYDLSGYTVLPGLIDTHVHITNHFNAKTGRIPGDLIESPAEVAFYGAENAYRLLMAGFTTVQSMGNPEDLELRDAIGRGLLPGPRLLTAIRWIREGSPEELRQQVRDVVSQGADLVKLFGSESLRTGGAPTLTQEQLDAACDEARRLGKRTNVHAHSDEAATRASKAGCNVIEHGAFLSKPVLELMARNGTSLDPNVYLVSENYLANQSRFIGFGNYTEEGFRLTRESIPVKLATFKRALEVDDLTVLFGTDAVAGAHGRNALELVYRVEEGGQDAMAAVISATSLAAESLDLADRIGTIAEGYEADIIALDGNPLEDITALQRVVFVMKGGIVYKSPPR